MGTQAPGDSPALTAAKNWHRDQIEEAAAQGDWAAVERMTKRSTAAIVRRYCAVLGVLPANW